MVLIEVAGAAGFGQRHIIRADLIEGLITYPADHPQFPGMTGVCMTGTGCFQCKEDGDSILAKWQEAMKRGE